MSKLSNRQPTRRQFRVLVSSDCHQPKKPELKDLWSVALIKATIVPSVALVLLFSLAGVFVVTKYPGTFDAGVAPTGATLKIQNQGQNK